MLGDRSSRMLWMLCAAAALVFVLASCGDDSNDESVNDPAAPTLAVAAETASPQSPTQAPQEAEPTDIPSPTEAPSPTAEPSARSAPEATPEPSLQCWLVEDFADGGVDRWRVVNDTVMGGQSDGGLEFVDGTMRFSGNISTDGGGFSSVRTELPLDALLDATQLRLRIRSDGRSYEVLADDVAEGRDFRVSHFGAIPLEGAGAWEEVLVRFDNLSPRVFGTPVNDAPFDANLASLLGIILADGADGPFLIEVDVIEACA